MKGAFGAAKPLPGQTGYKVSESAVLEKEAKDMETRLKALQDKMAMQQLEDESVTKVGGARWRSAREDKGSIHSYAKDVKERQQKATAKGAKINLLTGQPVFSNTNPLSGSAKAAPAAAAASSSLKINFTSHVADENAGNHSRQQEKNASPDGKAGDSPAAAAGSVSTISPLDWTSEQVGEWLTGTVGLPQYADVFAQNEMHGELLLDLSLADLDYMSVSVLAHRKKILKAVEGLRVRASSAAPSAGRGGGNMRGSSSVTAMKELPKAPVGTEAVSAPAPGQQHTVHWSHLQPLKQNEVTNEPMMPNAADGGVRAYSKGGEDDVLDEAAEQAAFREAVMAWRTSGKTVTAASASATQASTAASAANTGTGTSTQGNGGSPGKFSLLGGATTGGGGTASDAGGGGWSDPFAARPQMNDDDDDDDILGEKREAKMRQEQQQQQAASANRGPLSGVKTVGGMQIAYQPMTEAEELREREEFKKAVMQWRKDNGKGDAEAAKTETPKASSSGVGTVTGLNNNSVDSITDRLARQLDSQYESNARKLEEQKAAARLQMEKAARELEMARATRPAQTVAESKLKASMTDCSDDEDDGYVNVGGSSSSAGNKEFTSPSSHPDGDEDGGRAARLRLPLSGMKVAAAELPRTTPRIDLVDSTITYTARGEGGESKGGEADAGAAAEVQYLVEEASDDDDA